MNTGRVYASFPSSSVAPFSEMNNKMRKTRALSVSVTTKIGNPLRFSLTFPIERREFNFTSFGSKRHEESLSHYNDYKDCGDTGDSLCVM